VKPLEVNGKIIRDYEARGSLIFYDGKSCNCSIRAVQLANGKIMANCISSENINLLLDCLGKKDKIKLIKGVSKENDELLLEKDIWCTNIDTLWNSNELSVLLSGGSLKNEKTRSEFPTSVRFGITNFEYLGNKWREYGNGGGYRDILSVNLGTKNVELHQVRDYTNIMELINTQRTIDVTSEATVNISLINDLETVMPLINGLCKLLSLARGTKINWIYYDCYNSGGEKILSSHNNNAAWRYSALPLIDPRNFIDTAAFIEQTYPFYILMKDQYNLEKSIEVYLDAKREGVYLETRALVAAVLLDFLSDRYNTKSGKFRNNLDAMLQGLNLTNSSADIKRIIKIRNSLAHKASFVNNISELNINDYYFLIGTIDKIFLKMLNYNGIFLDITNNFNRIQI
jgi:hypothetical protein